MTVLRRKRPMTLAEVPRGFFGPSPMTAALLQQEILVLPGMVARIASAGAVRSLQLWGARSGTISMSWRSLSRTWRCRPRRPVLCVVVFSMPLLLRGSSRGAAPPSVLLGPMESPLRCQPVWSVAVPAFGLYSPAMAGPAPYTGDYGALGQRTIAEQVDLEQTTGKWRRPPISCVPRWASGCGAT